jgi:hypothetical protein
MTWQQRVVLLVLGLALLGISLALIRRRRLREEYAVLWICTSLAMLVLVLMPSALFGVASWLGLEKEGSAVLLLAVIFLAAVAVHFSVVITRYADRERDLAQEVALLKDELMRLRTEAREAPPLPPEPKPRPPALRT